MSELREDGVSNVWVDEPPKDEADYYRLPENYQSFPLVQWGQAILQQV